MTHFVISDMTKGYFVKDGRRGGTYWSRDIADGFKFSTRRMAQRSADLLQHCGPLTIKEETSLNAQKSEAKK